MIKIPEDKLYEVCKMGQGKDCCRYMVVDPDVGIACAKHSELSVTIDHQVDKMVAQGDNCEGLK